MLAPASSRSCGFKVAVLPTFTPLNESNDVAEYPVLAPSPQSHSKLSVGPGSKFGIGRSRFGLKIRTTFYRRVMPERVGTGAYEKNSSIAGLLVSTARGSVVQEACELWSVLRLRLSRMLPLAWALEPSDASMPS